MAEARTGLILLVQVILTVVAIIMSGYGGMPATATVAIGVLGATTIARSITSGQRLDVLYRWCIGIAWVCTLLVPASIFLPRAGPVTLELFLSRYFAVLSWVVAATILPAARKSAPGSMQSTWRVPVIIWAGFGCSVWLAAAYVYNQTLPFYAGILITIALLIAAQIWFRMPLPALHIVNTLILLLIGLPLVDLLVRPSAYLDKDLAPEKRYYSYEVAREDPAGFARWWGLFCSEFDNMGRALYMRDPAHRVPFKARPGAEANLFRSTVRINTRGFRGDEIIRPKGNVYRIVCLGESTTFGCTLAESDKPWPDMLEDMIEELHMRRPVQIINAGLPSYNLENSLARMASDILPLRPDMIICYHGYNGFSLLHDSFPLSRVAAPPAYVPRPLRLLALVEHRVKLMEYNRRLTSRLREQPPVVTNLLTTAYARAYERLIQIAHTNHIRLVLATQSMAVNQKSDPDVIEFYRAGFPAVHWQIQANRLHTHLLRQLALEHPEIRLVDTRAGLDGNHDQFIDLVHLTESGREQLATNFFSAIKNELTSEFSAQKPGQASWGSD